MAIIKMARPNYAAGLMVKKTTQQVYDDMIEMNGLLFCDAVTFGAVITPIVDAECVEQAYVICWYNKMVSVTHYTPGDEFLLLAGVCEWRGDEYPTADEALEIYYRVSGFG